MTQSNDSLGDLHLPPRGVEMRDGYEGHRAPGWRQLLSAWFILLSVAALFKITDFISAHRTDHFAHATNLAQVAEVEQTGDIEHWERGVPRRQWTITVPSDRKIIMVSRFDQ
jgi:allantoicase